ncbi:hypothetical protein KKE99_05235 [Patescibacteria group bacterium]|nr:hypothetical protein [Patescibacteria group bacterium]
MSKIKEELGDKTEQINYKEVIEEYPWIVEREQNCILSPDSDGLLCGLFMSNYLGWKIKGFYDGKILVLDKNVSAKDCVFLDVEIFRKEIKSVGHHMVLFNKNKKPKSWKNFESSIQPNIFRDHDAYNDFRLKYPLATIHMLIGIIGSKIKIKISTSAICPLLYTDGVFKNLFGYPENCIDWLKYLRANEKNNSLNTIFFNEHYSIHSLMTALNDFFEQIKKIHQNKRGNDKIKISNSKGEPINIEEKNGALSIVLDEKNKSEHFIKILSGLTGWKYKKLDWSWDNFQLNKFRKGSIRPNNRNFEALIKKKPISWAMTSGLAIEYTLDPKNILLK